MPVAADLSEAGADMVDGVNGGAAQALTTELHLVCRQHPAETSTSDQHPSVGRTARGSHPTQKE
jgi:hypothetical protein